ncbi:hypothetical protein [Agromyces humi]|uniref:hypothetical protein n=1 Tax=Agromyces humi TaxID=1766800 RepID=UPI00135A9B54|nr:hypothetical protein [Agromyces humi]
MSDYIYQPGGLLGTLERENAQLRADNERLREVAYPRPVATAPIDDVVLTETVKATAGPVDEALAALYEQLDRLAPDGIDNRVWIASLEHTAGDVIEGYRDWVQETWEFPAEDEAV